MSVLGLASCGLDLQEIYKESLPFGSIKSFVFDDRLQAVWACVPQTDSAARLQLIDARSGMVRSDYLLNDNGDCADATVGRDGTLYALDQANMRVLRIKRGDAGPSVWLSGDASAGSGYRWSALSVDNMGGIFLLSHAQGRLQRVAVRWDGSAGLPVEICLPRPLRSPVAIKPMAKRKLLVTEASGDLTLIAVMGEAGTLTTLASTITGPGNIAVVNGTAYVAESQSTQRDAYSLQPFRLVSVPLPSL